MMGQQGLRGKGERIWACISLQKTYTGGNAAGHQGVVRRFGGGEEGYKGTSLEGG